MAISDVFHKTPSLVSVIGIGGDAGRIVNEMRASESGEIGLYVFGTDSSELSGLSIDNKYLLGDGLGSGNERACAEAVCVESLTLIEESVNSSPFEVFVVSLGGTGEGCLKTFLHATDKEKTLVKLLAVTLPRSSEGMDKRDRAIKLLGEIENDVDGVFVVDMDDLHGGTASETFDKSGRKLIGFISSFASLFVRRSTIFFDWIDVSTFLRGRSRTKFVDYFTLSGGIDYLRAELKDIRRLLPPGYRSLEDVSNLIVAMYRNPNTNADTIAFSEIVRDCVTNTLNHAETRLAINEDPAIPENVFRIDVFTKCN